MSPRSIAAPAAILLLVVALICPYAMAIPLPEGGSFPYIGDSGLSVGQWIEPNALATVVYSTAGYISQRILPNGNLMITTSRAGSFMCIDENTFLVLNSGVRFTTASEEGVPFQDCTIRRVMGNTVTFVNVPLSEGRCPDVSELPVANTTVNIDPTGVVGKGTRVLVNTTIPRPNPPICVNVSATFTPMTTPLPTSYPLPTGTPCATYPNTGGQSVTQGIWVRLVDGLPTTTTSVEMTNAWGTNNYNADPTVISGSVGRYITSECVNSTAANVVSFFTRFTLNGTTATGWSCRMKVRDPAANTLTVAANSSATTGDAFGLVSPLPGNPNTTCGAPPPAPPPVIIPSPPAPPATCTYRGLWRISPLHYPCKNMSLSYSMTDCDSTSVIPMTMRTQASTGSKSVWGLNFDYRPNEQSDSTITAQRMDGCTNTDLAAQMDPLSDAPQLYVTSPDGPGHHDDTWRIVPWKRSCSEVNLIFKGNDAYDGLYLTLPKSCSGFVWSKKDNGRARFKLTKVSELIMP